MMITFVRTFGMIAVLISASGYAAAQDAPQEKRLQTEEEWKELVPVTGEIETFFGKIRARSQLSNQKDVRRHL